MQIASVFRFLISSTIIWFLVGPSCFAQGTQTGRPIGPEDIAKWNRIADPVAISPDGNWFGYRLVHPDGKVDAIIRCTTDETEFRFSDGQSSYDNIVFSEDSQWVAFTKSADPRAEDRVKASKLVSLVDLRTGKLVEFENVQRFVFSGKQSSWLALHLSQGETQQKQKGTTLVLHDLSTGNQTKVESVSEFAFTGDGSLLVWIIDTPSKQGNGLQLRNMNTGRIIPLETDTATYSHVSWTEGGSRSAVAVLKSMDDGHIDDKQYVVGFDNLSAEVPNKVIYDPAIDERFPSGMTISTSAAPHWAEDLSGIYFKIVRIKTTEDNRTAEATNLDEDTSADRPNLVMWDWRNKGDDLRSESRSSSSSERKRNYLCIYRVPEKRFVRLSKDSLDVRPDVSNKWALGVDTQEYDRTNSFWRSYQDLYVVDLNTGAHRLAMKRNENYYGSQGYKISPDGFSFLYCRAGQFFIYEIETGRSHNITKSVPTSFVSDEHLVKRPFTLPSAALWSIDGSVVLLSDGWDIWRVPTRGGTATNLTGNGKTSRIRYRIIRFANTSGVIDLADPVYLSFYDHKTKKRGFGKLNAASRGVNYLAREDADFSSDPLDDVPKLIKAKSAEKFVFPKQTFKEYPDYYVADGSFQQVRKLTGINSNERNFVWSSGVRVIPYKTSRGDTLYASLLLPANFESHKKYPLIVYVYERTSNVSYKFPQSLAIAFSPSMYASNGYAVLLPDLAYELNNPGISAARGIVTAVTAAVASGIVDQERIGLYGQSFGGYETAFTIARTDIFKAAAMGAGVTDLVSYYASLRNFKQPQYDYFETTQGRLGPLWQNLTAYIRNSPVYNAPRVSTPLLMWHNDKDDAVPWNQAIEYFNALRRLNRRVTLLEYEGEGHSFSKRVNAVDCTTRIKEFFDHYLLDKPAPKWLNTGVLGQ